MTDASLTTVPAAPRPDAATPLLFAVAIFTSASLVFLVQPMAAKLILPMLGGSPSVWNTSMVFFQAALLAGYGYAHLLQRVKSIRIQASIHLALLLAAALFLPLQISGAMGEPDPAAPIAWLLATLAISVGAPFAVLSATAPLLQAWYARVRAGYPDGHNPYVLYAASNLGSFLALLAYPAVVEPLMTLSGQRGLWSGGYGVFVALIAALAVIVWRRREDKSVAEPAPLPRSAPLTWKARAILILLAAAPSSLMLGVTTHLSTDVASAPFLWVAPLALYLLTFVIAFTNKPIIPVWVTLLVQAALVASCVSMLAFRTGFWPVMFALHIATFFFTALMCHQLLALRRPPPDRLTEFYLLLSLGGVLGGAFNALVAPAIFNMVWEYPLVLIAVGLARPWRNSQITTMDAMILVVATFITAAPPVALEIMRYNPDFRAMFDATTLIQTTQIILGAAAVCAFLVRERALLFVAVLFMINLSAQHVGRGYDWDLSERSFFGVMRVASTPDPGLGGEMHVMMHGTTLHGAQATSPDFRCMPTLYYAPSTPIGQATQVVQTRRPEAVIGVVGQGTGAMAGFKRAGDALTFFEIDPMVDRLSRDPRWFTFISDCAVGPVRTVLGDARLTLAKEPEGAYDLLLIDAFSSDAIPTHLLTVEALREYLSLLKPDGVLVLHLSNRNLEITLPAQAAAQALGVQARHQVYIERPDTPDMAEASTEALILSPTPQGLAEFDADGRWNQLAPTEVRPWTDDYVNLFGALLRHHGLSRHSY
ncbi:spermidine synthase [Brevundimonas sp. S30B]|uniref:spermidine synthase n=1 Tax=unclassified Brevundimonas TaxID=2622653 RepID=UPI0010720277|nr:MULTISPECIES: fused MFS/spermidine synthase [unclassified Brevundimonas]QBX37903.1 spermidine synthase [Brevundimonas sp. MF30-B]TFW02742.1 spermidine synthase [Brevundimonas sp. S30B]